MPSGQPFVSSVTAQRPPGASQAQEQVVRFVVRISNSSELVAGLRVGNAYQRCFRVRERLCGEAEKKTPINL